MGRTHHDVDHLVHSLPTTSLLAFSTTRTDKVDLQRHPPIVAHVCQKALQLAPGRKKTGTISCACANHNHVQHRRFCLPKARSCGAAGYIRQEVSEAKVGAMATQSFCAGSHEEGSGDVALAIVSLGLVQKLRYVVPKRYKRCLGSGRATRFEKIKWQAKKLKRTGRVQTMASVVFVEVIQPSHTHVAAGLLEFTDSSLVEICRQRYLWDGARVSVLASRTNYGISKTSYKGKANNRLHAWQELGTKFGKPPGPSDIHNSQHSATPCLPPSQHHWRARGSLSLCLPLGLRASFAACCCLGRAR